MDGWIPYPLSLFIVQPQVLGIGVADGPGIAPDVEFVRQFVELFYKISACMV